MLIGHQLSVVDKPLQRFLLEDALITAEIIEHAAIENEKTCAGAAAGPCLFLKVGHATYGVCLDDSEAGTRSDGRDRGQLPVTLVELQQFSDVHVADAVAIGQHEEIFTNILLNPLHPSARHRVLPGIDERNLKVLFAMDVFVLNLGVPAEADGEIVVHRLVVQEIVLNHVAAVSEAEHKISKTIVCIQLHDVPQDRTPADFYQGLGPIFSFLAQARTEPSAQHHYFHAILLVGASASFPDFIRSSDLRQGKLIAVGTRSDVARKLQRGAEKRIPSRTFRETGWPSVCAGWNSQWLRAASSGPTSASSEFWGIETCSSLPEVFMIAEATITLCAYLRRSSGANCGISLSMA